MIECKVTSCEKQRRRKGYCDHHWYCWSKYGDPLLEKWPKHGNYMTPEHRSWTSMRLRCNNPNATSYQNYGGRGIKICDRWDKSFVNFLTDMGKKPTNKHSLDRIDSKGNYEPSNCRWVTIHVQAANHRNSNSIVGVSYNKRTGMWAAQLIINGKSVIRPVLYPTYEMAVKARHAAELLYLGYQLTKD